MDDTSRSSVDSPMKTADQEVDTGTNTSVVGTQAMIDI